jgi:hypothetical protein
MEKDRYGEDSILFNVSLVEVAGTNPQAELAQTQPAVQLQPMLNDQNVTAELKKEIALMKRKQMT